MGGFILAGWSSYILGLAQQFSKLKFKTSTFLSDSLSLSVFVFFTKFQTHMKNPGLQKQAKKTQTLLFWDTANL